MTSKELALSTINSAGIQLNKVLENLPDSSADLQVTPQAMTPKRMIGHFCECYVAYDKLTKGEEHEWGTYTAPDLPMNELVTHMKGLRANAVALVEAGDGTKHLHEALEYIAVHDSYHIGQLALLRMQSEPEWNPYSLYE